MKESVNYYKEIYPKYFDEHYEFYQIGDMNLSKKIDKKEVQ
jgi:hypothetical protein